MGVLDDALKANGRVLTSVDYDAITSLALFIFCKSVILLWFVHSEITFESQTACNDVHYTLMAKLSLPTPEIRLKALAVIKHLLVHGHPFFKETLQKRHRPLQLCGSLPLFLSLVHLSR